MCSEQPLNQSRCRRVPKTKVSVLVGYWKSGSLSVPSLSLSWSGRPCGCNLEAGLCQSGSGPWQVRGAQASSTRACGMREQPEGGGRETGVVHGEAQLRAEPREPTEPALRSQISHRQAAGFGRLPSPFSSPKCRQSPLEPWPALLAAPKTRASSEAGMAGRGGRRRRMPLRRRRD